MYHIEVLALYIVKSNSVLSDKPQLLIRKDHVFVCDENKPQDMNKT